MSETRPARARAPKSSIKNLAELLAFTAIVTTSSACFFAPNVAADGYNACESDADCAAGRSCGEGLCAPPPWDDQKFESRRLLVVKNASTAKLAKGTAVPVVVGGPQALLQLSDVPADFRVTDFDVTTKSWSVVPVSLDRESDRFTIWTPLQRDVAAGKSDALAWIEAETAAKTPTVVEDASHAFTAFDGFDAASLSSSWRVRGTPTIANGTVNVADSQAIAFQLPLAPPVEATMIVRVNGVTCDQVFIGLIGDDHSLFPVGPAAGLFISQNLNAKARIAADADQTPTDFGDGIVAKTTFQHLVIDVDGSFVSVRDDDEIVYSDQNLLPAFASAPMFLAVQVAGACSVDVDAVWATPLPHPPPVVTADGIVKFQLFSP